MAAAEADIRYALERIGKREERAVAADVGERALIAEELAYAKALTEADLAEATARGFGDKARRAATAEATANEAIAALSPHKEEGAAWPRPPSAASQEERSYEMNIRPQADLYFTGPKKDIVHVRDTEERRYAFFLLKLRTIPGWWLPTGEALPTMRQASATNDQLDFPNRFLVAAGAVWDDEHDEALDPPHRVAQRRGTAHTQSIEIEHIELVRQAAGGGLGRRFLVRMQRFAMLEGFFALAASWVHQPFLAMATSVGGGWLDVLFNRDSRGRSQQPRPTDLFMPPVIGSKVGLMTGPWHLSWSPPTIRLWARLPEDADAEVLRFAADAQDWYARPQPDRRTASFKWNGNLIGAHLALVAHTQSKLHGCAAIANAAQRPSHLGLDDGAHWWVLHVRRLRAGDRTLSRLLVAFVVDLAYALGRVVTIDAQSGLHEEDLRDMWKPGRAYQHAYWQPGMFPWPFLYKVTASGDYRAGAAVYVYYPTPPPPEPTLADAREHPRRSVQSDTANAQLKLKAAHDQLASTVRRAARDEEGEATQEPDRPAKRPRFECVACARYLNGLFLREGRLHPVVCDQDCLDALDGDMFY